MKMIAVDGLAPNPKQRHDPLQDQILGIALDQREFIATFEQAQRIARKYAVHLVDWLACDDDRIRCARLHTFAPAAEPGWWDVPDLPSAS